jgi:hypothetical protein
MGTAVLAVVLSLGVAQQTPPPYFLWGYPNQQQYAQPTDYQIRGDIRQPERAMFVIYPPRLDR